MKKILTIVLFLGLATVLQVLHAADTVVVIVNSENTQSLTAEDIKNIYSDVVTTWDDGKRVRLYNLPAEDTARETFSRAIFGLSAREIVQQESNRKITNSVKNPSNTKRARLISTIVAKNKHAIGYLPKNLLKANKNIRILMELE